MSTALIPLRNLASEANAWLECAQVADDRAHDARLAAGKVLAKARERVRAGEPGHRNWAKWVRENIKHSYRYANKCIALARAPDPRAALSAERENVRRSMALSRSKVGPTLDPPAPSAAPVARIITIATVKRDILSLSAADRTAVAEWFSSHAEVQRDRHGNVLDPLPVRLKRVLHRLRKKGNRWSENFGLDVAQRARGDDYDDSLRELEQIVTELDNPWSPSRQDDAVPRQANF
jgi:hypothetical protein